MKTGDGRYILLTAVLNTSALCSCTHQSDLNHCTLLPANANNILYFLRSGSNSNIPSSPFSFPSFPKYTRPQWQLSPAREPAVPPRLCSRVPDDQCALCLTGDPLTYWLVSSDALLTSSLRASTKCFYVLSLCSPCLGFFILNRDIGICHQLFEVFSHCFFFGYIFIPTFFPGTSILLRCQQL